jgi:hypothetical protein
MSEEFRPPEFVSHEARERYFKRYGTWEVTPEQCLTCVTCGEPIYPGTPIAYGPVHRTFDCCPPGVGGWSIHDPIQSQGEMK